MKEMSRADGRSSGMEGSFAEPGRQVWRFGGLAENIRKTVRGKPRECYLAGQCLHRNVSKIGISC